MILHYRHYSSALGATAEPLLILHGMYGNQGNWAWHAKALASDFDVYALDVRNHGQSAHAESMTLPEMAQDVADTMDVLGLRSAHLLGHSMGGKIAMLLALQQPARVRSLIVVDIAPVAYPRGDIQVLEALCALDLASLQSRAAADAALSAQVVSKGVRDFLLANLQKAEGGGFSWRFNLPVLKQFFPEIISWPHTGRTYSGPVLFIKGANSDYILPEHQASTLSQFPAAKIKIVAGAGHWVHSEKPETFQKLVGNFLPGLGGRASGGPD